LPARHLTTGLYGIPRRVATGYGGTIGGSGKLWYHTGQHEEGRSGASW
jgi:hypothetical protein